MNNKKELEKLIKEYNNLQNLYGDPSLDSINFGGCTENPNIFFIFMNPTGKIIASSKEWKGRKSPWIGIKNIWKLFYEIKVIDEKTYNEIIIKKPTDWTYEFADELYEKINQNKHFITNLGKCTQKDARALPDETLKRYLSLLLKEIDIVKPKIIITFGNQVSSIILNKKISVSTCRKQYYEKIINKNTYKIFPVYYPIGNGIYNLDKAIEDINWIINNNLNNNF